MKTIKNLLGIIVCLLFITSIGYSQESIAEKPDQPNVLIGDGMESAMFASCNINAGGDISYCITGDTIGLFGSQSGIDLTSISWTLNYGPGLVTITNPSSLITSFVGAPSLVAGTYSFVISGTCTSDNTIKTDTVLITVKPPSTVAQISDNTGTLLIDTFVVCTQLQLVGNSPGLGETGYWSSTAGVAFSQVGDTLNASMSLSSVCTHRTFYYTISNGGCESTDTIVVRFERGSNNVYIYSGDRNLCGDTVRVYGSLFGCNGSGSWTIIPPSGVSVPSFQSYSSGRYIDIFFTDGGHYQIIYNVTSTGVCPGGSDTVDYNICLSNANGIGGFQDKYVCDSFPDTVFLSSIVHPSYVYGGWYAIGAAGTPTVVVTQTSVGQGYALIYDQTLNYYQFRINAVGDSCNFPDSTSVICGASKTFRIFRAKKFVDTSDTLNIFCQNPGEYYRPSDYISLTGYVGGVTMNAVQVPPGCTNIVQGNNYSFNSYLDFSCEGTYIFRTVTCANIGGGQTCCDTLQWVVNVATLQQPSAGSDAHTRVCDNDTVPLVGSAALDLLGNPNPFAISTWTQIGGPISINLSLLGTVNDQILDVTGFTIAGTYAFEYSFSRDSNCYLADTMFVTVDSCDSCPEFKLQTCCDLISSGRSSSATLDPAIKRIIDQYQQAMKSKYRSSSIDCCSPCNNPTDSFPVFVTDLNNNLINPTLYTITWSHDASNNNNHAFIFPNQQTIVTVSGPDSCVWSDTFLLTCCLDTISITPFCTWNPCDYPNLPIPLNVQDVNGNILGSGYSMVWSNGFTTNATSSLLSNLPISVIVYDSATGCIYYDTFDISCPTSCFPVVPSRLECNVSKSGIQTLTWASIPGMTYELEMNYNDPRCCKTGILPTGIRYTLTTNSYSGPFAHQCFSWRVRSICPDGTKSAWSGYECSCLPLLCKPVTPTSFKCNVSKSGIQTLSWNTTVGLTYQVEIIYNDPFCVKGGTGSTPVIFNVSGGSYTVNVSPKSGCLSWRVRSVCPDGTVSRWSAKQCCCKPVCNPIRPTNLGCKVSKTGIQTLVWTPTVGLTYEVEIIYNDPFCVKGGTASAPVIFKVSGGSYTVNVSPKSGCLSWRVRSICPNGARSAWSAKQCCCKIVTSQCVPKIPSGLKCQVTKGGQLLTWNAVAGATYEITFYYGDPKCCKNQLGYVTIPTSVNTNSFFVSSSKCFSWQIRSVCPNGTKSGWIWACSCSGSIDIRSSETGQTKINTKSGGSISNQEMKVSTAPNPAIDFVTFDVNTKEATQELGRIEVISPLGETVFTGQIKLNGKTMVDLTSLSAGTYIYKVISDGTFKSGRIVITN